MFTILTGTIYLCIGFLVAMITTVFDYEKSMTVDTGFVVVCFWPLFLVVAVTKNMATLAIYLGQRIRYWIIS